MRQGPGASVQHTVTRTRIETRTTEVVKIGVKCIGTDPHKAYVGPPDIITDRQNGRERDPLHAVPWSF